MPDTPETPEESPLAPPTSADTTKENAPMLDVHPAHHAANTWREFLTHIATIVIGLLIAVGLEQTVEYIHHRRELTQARKELSEEKIANIEGFHQSAASFEAAGLYLRDYLATLRQSIKDPASPPPILRSHIGFVFCQYTAWNAAQRGDALTLMPSDEQSANDRMYVGLHTMDDAENTAFLAVHKAEALFSSGLDPHDLTLEEKKQLYRDVSLALVDIDHALLVQRITLHFNPEFGGQHPLNPNPGVPAP